ncbi:MAG: murein biosynthesis integral membrane protein MurJ [Candidatus Atribacteria bacterium]|nr:murein biosynthesis integral membrane protein MurJ [Candidatus Atribacteria bacterium]
MTDGNLRLAKYTGIVMFATLLCRILGLGREIVISNLFGAGLETDAFFVAFMIPNLLRSFLGEGALNSTFIPIFSDYLTHKDQKKAELFASNILNILVITLFIVIFLGVLGAPWIVDLIAAGFKQNPEKFALTIRLTRMMFPYIFFVAIAALFMGILNTYRRFFIPAIAPAMLNIGMIFFAIYYTREIGIFSLALGVLAGGLAQVLIHVPALVRDHFQYRWIIQWNDPGVKSFFHLFIPAILGLAIDRINFVVDRIIASYLSHGSISALYYANRLMQFPLGVFGIALSVAILPTISRYVSKNQINEMKDTFCYGMKILSFFILPSTVALIVLSHPVIRLFYEHGVFSSKDTRMTEVALVSYTVGLFATAALRLVINAFYALKDTRTPLKIGSLIVMINIILDLIMVRYLAHAGIALATSIAAILHFITLSIYLNKKVNGIYNRELYIFWWKISLLSLLMGICCWLIATYFSLAFDLNNKIVQISQVMISSSLGLIVYYFGGIMMGIPEFKNMKSTIRKLFKGRIQEEDNHD